MTQEGAETPSCIFAGEREIMKHKRTWIVVADGAQARILLYTGHESGVRQLPNSDFREFHPPTRELVTDRPARVQESGSATRHAIEPRTDAHEQRKERFLAQLTSRLERAAQNNEFEHLVVVAPAPAMGELRKDFSPLLKQRLHGEFVHDYVHQPNDYIYRHIKDGLPL
jgi:protein required for attachment to host cells